jgi:hypothetical protein
MCYMVRQCFKMECVATTKLNYPDAKFDLEGFDMTVQLMNQLIFILWLQIHLVQVATQIHEKSKMRTQSSLIRSGTSISVFISRKMKISLLRL